MVNIFRNSFGSPLIEFFFYFLLNLSFFALSEMQILFPVLFPKKFVFICFFPPFSSFANDIFIFFNSYSWTWQNLLLLAFDFFCKEKDPLIRLNPIENSQHEQNLFKFKFTPMFFFFPKWFLFTVLILGQKHLAKIADRKSKQFLFSQAINLHFSEIIH